MFRRRKETEQEKARLRAECKKILEKQLQMLSEYSEKYCKYEDLDRVTEAMIRITEFL